MAELRNSKTILLVAVVLLLSIPATAQKLNPVSWSAKVEPAQLKPGSKAKVLITAKIDDTWHLYSLTQPAGGPRPTKISLADGSFVTAEGSAQQPKPKVAFDPNFQLDTETFAGVVTFALPVKVNADAPAGAQKLVVKVYFQACDEHQCLPPRTREVEADVMIAAASAQSLPTPSPTVTAVLTPTPSPKVSPTPSVTVSPSPSPGATVSPSPTTSASPAIVPVTPNDGGNTGSGSLTLPGKTDNPLNKPNSNPQDSGLIGYLWAAIVAGFLSLLTPCVFPMIPITVSFFTKRNQESRASGIRQAFVYCLGIIFTFTALGLIITALYGATGISNIATSPWMNLALTLLFVVLALNLFGLFEIRVPSGLLSKLDSKSQGGGMIPTLLMGLTFALTSFTCTFAFVGAVLVTATQGNWTWAAIGMIAFSTAFAAPFFLLALFPQWLKTLPSSGGWLNSVKVVMGFLELAAALKFLSNTDLVWNWQLLTRNLFLALWIAIAFMTAIYLLGKFQLPYDTAIERLGVVRMLMSVLFLGFAFYLLSGLFGARLQPDLDSFLPPANYGGGTIAAVNNTPAYGGSVQPSGLKWHESYDEALTLARAQNKPVFLNFTGITCTNCRWMEGNMFPDPAVKKELDRFILAELYTDRDKPEDEKNGLFQEKEFGTVALPLYAIIAPNGDKLAQFPGLTRDKAEFIRFLQSGANQFGQIAQSR